MRVINTPLAVLSPHRVAQEMPQRDMVRPHGPAIRPFPWLKSMYYKFLKRREKARGERHFTTVGLLGFRSRIAHPCRAGAYEYALIRDVVDDGLLRAVPCPLELDDSHGWWI